MLNHELVDIALYHTAKQIKELQEFQEKLQFIRKLKGSKKN